MSKSSPEEREELAKQARALIEAEGTKGIMIQLFVMMSNDMQHLGRAVSGINATLRVLAPLTFLSITVAVGAAVLK